MADVPSNLIPTRITQLPVAPTASLESLIMIVLNGQNYNIRVGDLLAFVGGTVQSVNASGGSTGLNFSGGPITTSGTLTLSGTLGIANGGTGAVNAPGARSNLSAAASGANSDITSLTGLSGGISTADYLDLDTAAAPVAAVGRLAWDATYGAPTTALTGGNVSANLGLQVFAYVHNAEATTINKGQPVYLYQATGNKASVKLAYNTSDATSAKTLGLAAENIAAGSTGYVITQGVLGGINTGAFSEGDTLYLGATAGTLTATKPYAPNHLVYIGVVERANAGAGQVYVRPQNGYELEELHNVSAQSPTNGQTLTYNSTSSLWEKTNQSALSVGAAATSAAISGGVAGQVPYQSGPGVTAFVTNGTAGQVLRSTGTTAPSWGNMDGGVF